MNTKSLGLIVAVLLGLVVSARAQPNLDFTLVNKTGYGIKEIYIAPSSSDNWEENILKEVLNDGESLDVSFSPEATSKLWDLKIVWEDGGDAVFWKQQNLAEISKITLHYNEDKDETSAETE